MTDVRPSVAIVEAVAREAGCDPLDLPPLYDSLDPDALDRLFPLPAGGDLTIHYHGYEVTVADVDDIVVTEVDAGSGSTPLPAGLSD